MDYLSNLKNLKKEFLEAGRNKYKSLFIVWRILLTIIFLPVRIAFFFGRIGYWFTWFFFKGLSAPVDYLQNWLKAQKEGVAQAPQAIIYLVCLPLIFFQHVILAFFSFAFFFQWFVLMLQAYVMTLGAVRWQPIITDAKF